MAGDLVSGRFPLTYPFAKAVGLASNNAQANISVRSNLEYMGIGDLTDAAAALVSGEATLVAVPVEAGDLVQYVDVLVGATAAGTPLHSWAALYNEAGALVGSQSVDGGSAAIAASARFTFTLGSDYIANPTDSPHGLLYAAVSVTATAVPSLVSGAIAAAAQYAWFASSPAKFGGTSGSALAGAAPGSITLSGVTGLATPPAVFLR